MEGEQVLGVGVRNKSLMEKSLHEELGNVELAKDGCSLADEEKK